jgi:hypothetical protein
MAHSLSHGDSDGKALEGALTTYAGGGDNGGLDTPHHVPSVGYSRSLGDGDSKALEGTLIAYTNEGCLGTPRHAPSIAQSRSLGSSDGDASDLLIGCSSNGGDGGLGTPCHAPSMAHGDSPGSSDDDGALTTSAHLLDLPSDLLLHILHTLHAFDVVALSGTASFLRIMAGERLLNGALCNAVRSRNMQRLYAYFSVQEGCIRPISHLVSLRQIAGYSRKKWDRGLYRAVRRAHPHNRLLLQRGRISQAFPWAF